jgi:hypothetical protein
MGKKSGSGSGMTNPDHISESLERIFCVKYFCSLMRIPGSGMEKIWIRDPDGKIKIRDGKIRIPDPGWKNSDPG